MAKESGKAGVGMASSSEAGREGRPGWMDGWSYSPLPPAEIHKPRAFAICTRTLRSYIRADVCRACSQRFQSS